MRRQQKEKKRTTYTNIPSLNCHLTMVEGFGCLNDPRSYVLGLFAPGRLTQSKLVLGQGPERARFKDLYEDKQGLVCSAWRDTVTLPWS